MDPSAIPSDEFDHESNVLAQHTAFPMLATIVAKDAFLLVSSEDRAVAFINAFCRLCEVASAMAMEVWH